MTWRLNKRFVLLGGGEVERLTIKKQNGDCVIKGNGCVYGWYSYGLDQGFEKDGLNGLKEAFYKLAEYENAEEEGRLTILPCKIGDTVWVVTHPINVFDDIEYDEYAQDELYEAYVSSITFYKNSNQYRIYAKETNQFIKAYFRGCDFGKTVFLSKKEAEKALKEMKNT